MRRLRPFAAVLLAGTGLAAAPAFAQAEPQPLPTAGEQVAEPAPEPAAADEQVEEEVEVSAPGSEGAEIVVTGRFIPEPVRNTAQVVSVISAAEIARTGDGDIAGALVRVTGLSVNTNGFVYVRGLGDRYSLALLNGLALPSPEPLRRVVPLDIFPTSIVSSAVVQKSYSVNYPGEYGGGAINLRRHQRDRNHGGNERCWGNGYWCRDNRRGGRLYRHQRLLRDGRHPVCAAFDCDRENRMRVLPGLIGETIHKTLGQRLPRVKRIHERIGIVHFVRVTPVGTDEERTVQAGDGRDAGCVNGGRRRERGPGLHLSHAQQGALIVGENVAGGICPGQVVADARRFGRGRRIQVSRRTRRQRQMERHQRIGAQAAVGSGHAYGKSRDRRSGRRCSAQRARDGIKRKPGW